MTKTYFCQHLRSGEINEKPFEEIHLREIQNSSAPQQVRNSFFVINEGLTDIAALYLVNKWNKSVLFKYWIK